MSGDSMVFSHDDAWGERNIIAEFDLLRDDAVTAITWSPNGNMLLVISRRGSSASVYRLMDKTLSRPMPISDFGTAANGAVFYDDGSFIAPVSGISSTRSATVSRLTLFDHNGKAVEPFIPPSLLGGFRDVNVLKISSSSDGQLLSFLGVDTTARGRGLSINDQWPAAIMSIDPRAVLVNSGRIAGDATRSVRDISLSSNGQWASALNSEGQARIWNKLRGDFITELSICRPRSTACTVSRISNSGKYLLTDGDDAADVGSGTVDKLIGTGVPRVWSVDDKDLYGVLHDDNHRSATSSSLSSWKFDDREIALADTGTVSIWTIGDKGPLLSFNRKVLRAPDGRTAYNVNGLSYSTKGMLAVAAGNHVIIYQ